MHQSSNVVKSPKELPGFLSCWLSLYKQSSKTSSPFPWFFLRGQTLTTTTNHFSMWCGGIGQRDNSSPTRASLPLSQQEASSADNGATDLYRHLRSAGSEVFWLNKLVLSGGVSMAAMRASSDVSLMLAGQTCETKTATILNVKVLVIIKLDTAERDQK